MTRVKICGITNFNDAQVAVNAGASALGFIFHKKSPRYVSPSKVRPIVEALPPFVTPVGVFVNGSEHAVRDICRLARISTVQFHGEESPGYCKRFKHFKIIKAFRVTDTFDFKSVLQYKVDAYLFDTFQEEAAGGTGKTFNWELLKNYEFDPSASPADTGALRIPSQGLKSLRLHKPVILSGGLNPDNVRQAIEAVRPYAVDVSSGVEKSPGVKNYRLVNAFCQAACPFLKLTPVSPCQPSENVLYLQRADKGKPGETRGHKATGLHCPQPERPLGNVGAVEDAKMVTGDMAAGLPKTKWG